MKVERVHFLVEEPSMEVALRILLPKMLPDIEFEVFQNSCKDQLLQLLPQRLRGYASWLPANWRIVVIVDRDDDDCVTLRRDLDRIAHDAGLSLRTSSNTPWQVVNRLAIEELEAWYFGDWDAVRAAYPKVPATIPNKQPYRNSDEIKGGTWEAFERVLQAAGYFKGGLRKRDAARAVAENMEPARNRSGSFQKLNALLGELARD